MGMATFAADEKQILDVIKKRYDSKADAYVVAAKKAYPVLKKPSDLLDIDFSFRPGAVLQANTKSETNGSAPVYMYMFTWDSPIMDGKFKSLHCMEIPFVFNNIARCEEMTGGGKDAYVLADKMSSSWINFAKTGNPNHSTLPKWMPYTSKNGETMFFDIKCEIRHHHDKELLDLVTK